MLFVEGSERRTEVITPPCRRNTSLPVVLCGHPVGKFTETKLNDDLINQKLVNMDDEHEIIPCLNSMKCRPYPSSLSGFTEYLPPDPFFNPSPRVQNIAKSSEKPKTVVTHLVHPNWLSPLVYTAPSSSSSSGDVSELSAEPRTFCPLHQMDETDLSMDETNVGLDRTPDIPSPDLSTGSDTSKLFDKLITIPANADEK